MNEQPSPKLRDKLDQALGDLVSSLIEAAFPEPGDSPAYVCVGPYSVHRFRDERGMLFHSVRVAGVELDCRGQGPGDELHPGGEAGWRIKRYD